MIDTIFDKCALLGYGLKPGELKPSIGPTIEYETEYVGKVKMTTIAYKELLEGAFERYVIAGICKYRTINKLEPVLIDSNFIREGFKKLNPPLEFDEKCFEVIKVLYQLYGKENREFELNTAQDCALGYSNSDEFTRIIDQLKTNFNITYRKKHSMGRDQGLNLFMGIKLTNSGKEEAKKALPKIPLFGLVNQEITTGNIETDVKLNHARKLFFSDPQAIDDMRSACETLSYILEPFRADLNNYFASKDVSDFFQIVNKFDIRHNKESTLKVSEPEQLEWIFYSLLNTINTYSKLKHRGK
tara:strand:- start:17 stop:916 length:900 start_codon:yes stop_codon:yes gene_type:complete